MNETEMIDNFFAGALWLAVLFCAFMIKHFVCDFLLQMFPYMYSNKGTYGHFGGISHAAIHGVATFLLVYFYAILDKDAMSWSPLLFAIKLGLLDLLVHYHIDWAKMNIAKKFNLTATNSEWFWVLTGFDQLLHHLTYGVILVLLIVKTHMSVSL